MVSLQISPSVAANSISITNQFSSLMQKKTNLKKKAWFSPGLVIWTGSLNFTYNQHYSQRKGWPNNTQPGAGEKEGVRCLSLGSHIQFYQLRWNHSNRLLLSVLCCGISTQYPFSHLPSLGISQNFPISTNQKNLDEFHKKGQGSYFYSNAPGFFSPRESSLQSTKA